VVAVSGCSSTGLVMVTVAPGSTAPDASVTLPKISPVWFWAHADDRPTVSASAGSMAVKRNLIWSSVKKLGLAMSGREQQHQMCQHSRSGCGELPHFGEQR
jgi:hypothetical protein